MAWWAGTMIQRTYKSPLLAYADADVQGATLTDTDCPICSEVPRYIPASDFERAPSPRSTSVADVPLSLIRDESLGKRLTSRFRPPDSLPPSWRARPLSCELSHDCAWSKGDRGASP